jgi:hypothetical protein
MSMIEKAAMAIASSAGVDYDMAWPEQQLMFRRQARAAVEALIRATPEMVTAAAIATDGWRFGQGTSINASIENALRAALGAALNEGEGA